MRFKYCSLLDKSLLYNDGNLKIRTKTSLINDALLIDIVITNQSDSLIEQFSINFSENKGTFLFDYNL